jgi:PAS domain S-box-containing protein
MRNEITILILQDRPIGLETLQDDLRRVQLFPFFSYIANAKELKSSFERPAPDVILLVHRYFDMSFEDVHHELRKLGREIPIIVILPAAQDLQGMDLIKRGAQDYLLESELQRLAPSIFLALRDHPVQTLRITETGDRKASEPSTPVIFEPTGYSNGRTAEALIGNLVDVVTELDLVGTILYESPSVTEQLGYGQEELIGRSAFSLVHPLDVPRVTSVFMVALTRPGIPHSVRFRFKHKNGSWRILESVGKSITQKEAGRRIIITSRVLTEETSSRTVIGDSEARFMYVVEGLAEGVLVTDTADKILYANKQMEQFTGHEVTEMLGQLSYQLFLPEAAWPTYLLQKEKWLLGNREEYEISVPRKDGSLLCMHVNVSPYRNSVGHITGTLAAFADITKRKQAEEEIQRTFEHLKTAKERAEEMNRLKTSFLSNVGHEVRTPLNSILGFSSLMSETLIGTEYASYAASIHASGKRLLDTFESILDLSRVESNTLELAPIRVSLDAEIYRIAALLGLQAREKGLELSVEVTSPLHAVVDPHYFERVLRNLINNAIKFTSTGFVRIQLGRSYNRDGAEIKIMDSGIGISDDFLPHIFEEFYQESDGLARNFEGTGLGLRIAKRLLDAMGGTLAVESTKGKGTCFTISLPLQTEMAMDAM